MQAVHYTKELVNIYNKIRSASIDSDRDVLMQVKEAAKLTNRIQYFGWNTYYHRWDVGSMAAKPRRSYLQYLAPLHKVTPDGKVYTYTPVITATRRKSMSWELSWKHN